MPSTLLLNPQTWDLMVAQTRDIAVAAEPYALAQDAASAIRLFEGEDYYDTTRGIPYWEEILGHWPPVRIMKAHFNAAAETVPGVASAQSFIESIVDRRPKGQVLVTSTSGAKAVVSFTIEPPPAPLPPDPEGGPSLDFSDPDNSQYLPIL
jgi:hypothetical protein